MSANRPNPFNMWRKILSRFVLVLLLAALVYWVWERHRLLHQLLADLGPGLLIGLCLVLTISVLLSACSFTILVRSLGYRFSYQESYHSLNLTQIAAMVPGKIWGFASLAGLLWSRGIPKRDSILIIFLHTLLSLSAAVLVGIVSLAPTIGWVYTLLCLLPMLVLLIGRSWCESVRMRFIGDSSALPASRYLLSVLSVGLCSWILMSACFAVLVYSIKGPTHMSSFLVASAFAAGYVGGFISPLTPAGLGVREGIIAAILGPGLGGEQVLAIALVFRAVHMAVLWLHVGFTAYWLSRRAKRTGTGWCQSRGTHSIYTHL